MILVDTSVWIEFLKNNPAFQNLEDLLNLGQVAGLEPIFAELLQGARTKREVSIITEYRAALKRLDTAELWFHAGLQSFENQYFSKGIGLIDAVIIAAARKHQCFIWTLDKRLQSALRPEELYQI